MRPITGDHEWNDAVWTGPGPYNALEAYKAGKRAIQGGDDE